MSPLSPGPTQLFRTCPAGGEKFVCPVPTTLRRTVVNYGEGGSQPSCSPYHCRCDRQRTQLPHPACTAVPAYSRWGPRSPPVPRRLGGNTPGRCLGGDGTSTPKECWLSHVCTGGRQNKAQKKMWLVSGLQDHRCLSVKIESKDARG